MPKIDAATRSWGGHEGVNNRLLMGPALNPSAAAGSGSRGAPVGSRSSELFDSRFIVWTWRQAFATPLVLFSRAIDDDARFLATAAVALRMSA